MGEPDMKGVDLTGRRFGRLVVAARAPDYVSADGCRKGVWLCRCDCGNEVRVRRDHLLDGTSRSCGCLKDELAREKMNAINARRRTAGG